MKNFRGTDPIKLYDIARNQDTFNFKSSASQVEIGSRYFRKKILDGCWDKQLLYLIRYRFSLNFDRNSKLGQNTKKSDRL